MMCTDKNRPVFYYDELQFLIEWEAKHSLSSQEETPNSTAKFQPHPSSKTPYSPKGPLYYTEPLVRYLNFKTV